MEACAILNGLRRRASQVEHSETRWRRDFGGSSVAVAADPTIAETISVRRRRQESVAPPALRPSSAVAYGLPVTQDPRISMEARHQRLRSAREERQRVEMSHQAKLLEKRATAATADCKERERRRRVEAEAVEHDRQQMAEELKRAR